MVPVLLVLEQLNGLLDLLEPGTVSTQDLGGHISLSEIHFDAVEQVADTEEAHSLADESQNFHLRQIPSNRKELEPRLNDSHGLNQVLKHMIADSLTLHLFQKGYSPI